MVIHFSPLVVNITMLNTIITLYQCKLAAQPPIGNPGTHKSLILIIVIIFRAMVALLVV